MAHGMKSANRTFSYNKGEEDFARMNIGEREYRYFFNQDGIYAAVLKPKHTPWMAGGLKEIRFEIDKGEKASRAFANFVGEDQVLELELPGSGKAMVVKGTIEGKQKDLLDQILRMKREIEEPSAIEHVKITVGLLK